ncbi:MAG TPA: hypothetical protein VII56_13125 [Rhizomicrobium sp.]
MAKHVSKYEVLPPEHSAYSRPIGTPFGIPLLGIARFKAMREFFEQATPSMRAAQDYVTATAEYIEARTRRVVATVHHAEALERLRNVAIIRDNVKMRILLEHHELRHRLQAVTADLEEPRSERRESIASAVNDLDALPVVARAAARAKAKIIREAGGEDRLGAGERNMIDAIDAFLTHSVSRQIEKHLR